MLKRRTSIKVFFFFWKVKYVKKGILIEIKKVRIKFFVLKLLPKIDTLAT